MTATAEMNGMSPGAAAMAKIPAAERMARHRRLLAYLETNEAHGRTAQEIADAVGISREPVMKEFRKAGVTITRGRTTRFFPAAPPRRPRGQRQPRPASDIRDESAPETRTPRERIEAYLKTGGEGSTAAEIARATGLPLSAVQDALSGLGLLAPGKPELPASREQALATVTAAVAPPASDGDAPEGKVVYLHQLSDGRHAALDLLTGRLWEMEVVRPL